MSLTTKPDTPDHAHLAWLIRSRESNQRASLTLHKLIDEHFDKVKKSKQLSVKAQVLAAVCFSLWRAAFLADKLGTHEATIQDVRAFLGKMLTDNAIDQAGSVHRRVLRLLDQPGLRQRRVVPPLRRARQQGGQPRQLQLLHQFGARYRGEGEPERRGPRELPRGGQHRQRHASPGRCGRHWCGRAQQQGRFPTGAPNQFGEVVHSPGGEVSGNMVFRGSDATPENCKR